MKKPIEKDLFIVVRAVMARDAAEAAKKEFREGKVINVYMDDDWKKNKVAKSDSIGFK